MSDDIGPGTSAPNQYRAIRFLVRHGEQLARVIGAAICIAGIAAALGGWGWGFALAGVLAAPLAYLLFRSYAEIVQVIAETLLPR